MLDKVTAPKVRAMRDRREPIVCLTAYDALFGAIADAAGVDIVLVGDSVGNVLLGYHSTVPVTLDEMRHHTAATARGVKRALLVADMPFGSYQSSTSQAVDSAVALMKAGAEAVKLEGAYEEAISAIVKAGIPVMGHVGMTPQSVNLFGGHKVQGKGDGADSVLETAEAVSEAGAFAMVLELIPSTLAEQITAAVAVPTIGIGAGIGCNGQVQVLADVLGLGEQSYRHAKPYTKGRELLADAIANYCTEVRAGVFPGPENSF